MSADTKTVSTQEELVAEAYAAHAPLMYYLASRRFNVPREDAENLIQEVFVSYLSARGSVRDTRAWLVGAICNASRGYCRKHQAVQLRTGDVEDLNDTPDPASVELSCRKADALTMRQTLSRLHEKCRRTLTLHYFEGYTAREVAERMTTTNRYAEKLIHECLRQAHMIYKRLTRVE